MNGSGQFWRVEAARLARQVNFGWGVQRWMQIGVPSCLVLACGVLLLRSRGWEPESVLMSESGSGSGLLGVTVVVGSLLVLISLAAWLASRGRFVSREEALVRLESKLGLEGALSSAAAGVGDWPQACGAGTVGAAHYRWRLARVVFPGLLAAVVLGASLLVPLGPSVAVAASAEEPAAWGQMEDWLETLEEEEVVDPTSAEEVREQIEQLRDRPEEEWFSHRSLEAGDSLKESLAQTIEAMGQDLEMAEQALASLESAGGGAALEGLRSELAQQYEAAAERLKASSLKLDPNLMEQLAKLDPSQLQQLDPKALEELRERLRKSAGS